MPLRILHCSLPAKPLYGRKFLAMEASLPGPPQSTKVSAFVLFFLPLRPCGRKKRAAGAKRGRARVFFWQKRLKRLYYNDKLILFCLSSYH